MSCVIVTATGADAQNSQNIRTNVTYERTRSSPRRRAPNAVARLAAAAAAAAHAPHDGAVPTLPLGWLGRRRTSRGKFDHRLFHQRSLQKLFIKAAMSMPPQATSEVEATTAEGGAEKAGPPPPMPPPSSPPPNYEQSQYDARFEP